MRPQSLWGEVGRVMGHQAPVLATNPLKQTRSSSPVAEGERTGSPAGPEARVGDGRGSAAGGEAGQAAPRGSRPEFVLSHEERCVRGLARGFFENTAESVVTCRLTTPVK